MVKKNTKVYIIYGWFGLAASGGIHAFGHYLQSKGYEVVFCRYQYPDWIVTNLEETTERTRPRALIGYSLGANCCAWVANRTNTMIDLIVGYDPTRRGPPLSNYPIGKNVRHCIQYNNRGLLFTNLFVGKGAYVNNGCPSFLSYDITDEHLLVQYNQKLHIITESALERVEKGDY